jgi:quinoprotein glucose dehydrogenase
MRSGLITLTLAANTALAQAGNEWRAWGGDLGATKYSSLTDINRENVSKLARAWEWSTNETADAATRTRPGNFQATPLMIGDTLFLSTSLNRVVALDANTGKELWSYDPKAYVAGQPPNGTGFVHRGVASWSDGKERRIFMNSAGISLRSTRPRGGRFAASATRVSSISRATWRAARSR